MAQHTQAKFDEHNEKTCCSIEVTQDLLSKLRHSYHNINGLPAYIDDLLHLNPQSKSIPILQKHPHLLKWSQDGTILMLPNLPFLDFDQDNVLQNPNAIKDNKDTGLCLIAWYIHPKILEKTVFSSPENRENLSSVLHRYSYAPALQPVNNMVRRYDKPRIGDLSKESGIPYLASVLDLTPSHLPWLRDLRSMMQEHLQQEYGVSEQDEVDIFFHQFIRYDHTTLHLQARVNQPAHKLEKRNRLYLDDVIKCLEEGKSIQDMILEQGATQFFKNAIGDFVRKIPGAKVKVVPNPDFVSTDTLVAGGHSTKVLAERVSQASTAAKRWC